MTSKKGPKTALEEILFVVENNNDIVSETNGIVSEILENQQKYICYVKGCTIRKGAT